MTRLVFAIPGELQTRSGGYEYDRRLLAALGPAGVEAVHCRLPARFPDPSDADLEASLAAIARELRKRDVVLIDGLAFGALPAATLRRIGAPLVALCHHPLCLETGLDPQRAAALRQSEGAALALAQRVIVTSPHTGALLAREFSVPAEKIAVAPPGVDPAPRSRGSSGSITLLAVGAIIPRKAFDLLIEALSKLADLDWRLRIVGSMSASPPTASALRAVITAKRLEPRVELTGELGPEDLGPAFDEADLFVSPSLYEGYGMALAQALARGLPIITTTGGAAAETAPDDACLKVAPGDVDALAAALRQAIGDARLRAQLSDASWRAGQCLPRWEDTAAIVARVTAEVAEAAP
ncbi:MAG: glycosyltransferase family 4 protein [Methylocystis sp.]